MRGKERDGVSVRMEGECANQDGVRVATVAFVVRAPATKQRVAPASQGYDEGTQEEFASFLDCLRTGKTPYSNHETARISTFMSFMGRKAMYDRESRQFTPEVVRWEDLGSRLPPA